MWWGNRLGIEFGLELQEDLLGVAELFVEPFLDFSPFGDGFRVDFDSARGHFLFESMEGFDAVFHGDGGVIGGGVSDVMAVTASHEFIPIEVAFGLVAVFAAGDEIGRFGAIPRRGFVIDEGMEMV